MDHHGISGIDEFDTKFRGTQSGCNWSSDFEMELDNAGKYDKSYLERRIEFCGEYVKRSEDKYDINIENMRRSIAESYIELGRQKEGDAIFKSYLMEILNGVGDGLVGQIPIGFLMEISKMITKRLKLY